MTLFPMPTKPQARLVDPRRGLRLPTGTPRLVESSRAREARTSAVAWQALLETVRRSAAARVDLLRGRSGSERLACAWKRLSGCDTHCRCRGAGTVSVDFLRRHYESLGTNLALLVRPASRRGS